MRKESNMLFLVVSLMCWTQTAGGCSGTIVSISTENRMLPAGEDLNLSCEFTCLGTQHVAQLWKNYEQEDKLCLVNLTSTHPNVTVVLSISSATKTDTGYYSCMTQPPDTISPAVWIQIAENLTTSTLIPTSTPQCGSTQLHSSAAGVQGQIWYWILLGKTAILIIFLATLAAKHKRG